MKIDRHAWTDAQILDVLDLGQNGLAAAEIAEAYDVSESAVLSLFAAVRRDTDNSESLQGYGAPASKPQNRDGGMPARWWSKGLKAQKRREVAA